MVPKSTHHVVMHVQDVVSVTRDDIGRVLVLLHDVEPHALLREIKVLDHESATNLGAEKNEPKNNDISG